MDTIGNTLIRGLCESQTDAIIDVRFGDADADTYKHKPIDKLVTRREKEKKDKHGKNCHEPRRKFYLFFLSVDFMVDKKALVVFSNLSRLVAEKLREPISHVRGWVNGRIRNHRS